MPASTIYAPQALKFSGTPDVEVPFVPGSLDCSGGLQTEDLRSGNSLTPDVISVVGKRPFLRSTILDPSLLSAAQAVGSGETVTSVVAAWRAYEQNGTLSSTYKSVTGAQGLLLPVTLNFSAQSRATLDVIFLAAFSSGTAFSVGTSAGTLATVSKAFYPTSLVVGGSLTIDDIQSGQVSYNYQSIDDNSQEPEYYSVNSAAKTGSVVTQDLAAVTAARLEDGAVETCVLTLTNRESGGGTVVVNLGDCFVQATINGGEASIEFAELTA